LREYLKIDLFMMTRTLMINITGIELVKLYFDNCPNIRLPPVFTVLRRKASMPSPSYYSSSIAFRWDI